MADPITGTGLALGILPIIISAIENYEVTFQPFITYRHYAKEAQRFMTKLGAQKAIFFNACQLLLLAVSDKENLADILNDPNHPTRYDGELERALQKLLGTSYDTCLSTIRLISDTLEEIMLETKDFRHLIDNSGSSGYTTASLIRQKIKLSFSKLRFTAIIDELRQYNGDLNTLSKQIRDLSLERRAQKSETLAINTVTAHVGITQQASKRLYEILAEKWACDDLIEHTASISLAVEGNITGQDQASEPNARFSLALACLSQDLQDWRNILWLEIESVSTRGEIHQVDGDEAAFQLTRGLQKLGVASRTVQFDLGSSRPSQISQSSGTQVNLSTRDKLCQYFHTQMINATTRDSCMVFFEKTQTFKHFLYPGKRSQVSTRRSTCLRKLFSDTRQKGEPYNWCEKLRLARTLALGAVRFHSTPWLDEAWTSEDVYFIHHGTEENASETSLRSPWLTVRLSPDSTRKRITKQDPPGQTALSIAPNGTLYSLGVILLELGYDAPLCDLRQSGDLIEGQANQFTDFFTARRLAHSVSKKYNPAYGRLVRKCLDCDFGVGSDLSSAELQGAVILHLVYALDHCLQVENEIERMLSSTSRV